MNEIETAILPQIVEPAAEKAKPLKSTRTADSECDQELLEACRQFEEIFMKTILKEARIDKGMMNGESTPDLYKEMTIETMARALTSGGGLGLSEVLYRQLSGTPADVSVPNYDEMIQSVQIERGE